MTSFPVADGERRRVPANLRQPWRHSSCAIRVLTADIDGVGTLSRRDNDGCLCGISFRTCRKDVPLFLSIRCIARMLIASSRATV
jgi:hypothetical protein